MHAFHTPFSVLVQFELGLYMHLSLLYDDRNSVALERGRGRVKEEEEGMSM